MALYGAAKAPAVPAAVDGTTVDAIGTVTITLSTSDTYADADVKAAVDAALATITDKIDALIAHMNDGRA